MICHNDFAPHNLVFHGGVLVGAIDFDTCSPGPRLGDLAYFATRAIPLSSGGDRDEIARRLELLPSPVTGPRRAGPSSSRSRSPGCTTSPTSQPSELSAFDKPELLDHVVGYQRDAEFVESLLSVSL